MAQSYKGPEHNGFLNNIRRYSGMDIHPGDDDADPEPLARLDYRAELEIKNRAIRSFLDGRIPAGVDEVMPSPLPRHYRTTTKRKVVVTPRGPRLLVNPAAPNVTESLLEPDVHSRIYKMAGDLLAGKIFRSLVERINFLICRGTYDEQVLIINVDRMDADVIRNCSILTRQLTRDIPSLLSAYVFHDPTRSNYYLDWSASAEGLKIKRLHGPRQIIIRMGEMTWACPPAGFSQVNQSLVPGLCSLVKEMLAPTGEGRLADLYCGYGLFSRYLADSYPEIFMMDMAGDSVDAARETMGRAGHTSYKAITRRITADAIETALPARGRELDIILDPPRGGCDRGVIEKSAVLRPRKVVHLFCDAGRVPEDIDRWIRNGYKPVRVKPLDMFPGTAHLEIAVLLEPAG